MNLYTLSKEMELILNSGYDEETTDDLIEGYKIAGEQEIDDLIKGIRNLEGENVAYSYEIERLSKKKGDNLKKIETIKKLIDNYMQSTSQESISTSFAKLSYRKSEAIEIVDTTLLDQEYMRTKITTEPDKTKIKEDIKKGIIVEGATLKTNYNLQIK